MYIIDRVIGEGAVFFGRTEDDARVALARYLQNCGIRRELATEALSGTLEKGLNYGEISQDEAPCSYDNPGSRDYVPSNLQDALVEYARSGRHPVGCLAAGCAWLLPSSIVRQILLLMSPWPPTSHLSQL